jgi:hypothetical protein
MILPAFFVTLALKPLLGPVTETKLFKIQKGKIVPGTILLSPDLMHYSYVSSDRKLILDGKAFGPYLTNTTPVYSGDGKDCAYIATINAKDGPVLVWNGVVRKTDYPVGNLFRAGDTGGIWWYERQENKTRLVHAEGVTDWFAKIDKLSVTDDASNFYLRTSEPIKSDPQKVDPGAPTSNDYIIKKDGTKTPRGNTLQVFPAPKGLDYAMLMGTGEVLFRGKSARVHGEFYGKPTFSPDGKQFVFRSEFTGPTKEGNKPFFHYNVNGLELNDLQIQTGFTFSPDGSKWVLCGLNGKEPFIHLSTYGLLSYGEFPGLAGVPPEPYKVAQFVNGKLVMLFQAKLGKPILYIEDKGVFELGEFKAAPETLEFSPDGKKLALAGMFRQETRALLVDLENPGIASELLKPGYDLQNLEKGTFIWKSDQELMYMILRNSELIRINQTL